MTTYHKKNISSEKSDLAINIPLHWIVSITFFILIMLTAVVFSIYSAYGLGRGVYQEIDKKLTIAVDLAKTCLGENYHDLIENSTSVSQNEYSQILIQFDNICLKHGLEYIWSVMDIDGQIRFTSGSSMNKKIHENYADFFEHHSNPEIYRPVFEKMEKTVLTIHDKWGDLYSVLVPFVDKKGRKFIIGASMKKSDVENIVIYQLCFHLLTGLILSIFFSALGHRVTKRFTIKIQAIIDSVHQVTTSGRYEFHIPETGPLEIRKLAETFNIMSNKISSQIIELEESEKKYRDFIDNSPDLFHRTDLNGTIQFISPSVYHYTGYTSEEAIGKNLVLEGYYDPGDREKILEMLNEKGVISNVESLQKKKDGSFWWASTNARWYKDKDGNVTGIVGVTRDVTKHKQAENALIQSEEKFRSIFENAPFGMVHIDSEGVVTALNEKLYSIFGAKKEDLLGKNVLIQVKNPDVLSILKRALKGEKGVYEGEYTSLGKSGKVPIRGTYSPIFSAEGNVTGLIGITEDLTEKKKQEEEKKVLEARLQQTYKMEAIGTLAGGIAHDFNNILTPLIGYSQLLKHQLSPDHPFQTNVNTMLSSALRARDLVKQILTFSRNDAAESIPVKIQPIIKESLKLIRSSIPSTIEMDADVSETCGWINGDPTKLHQVLINLSTNAYHAMERTGGKLKISLNQVTITPDASKQTEIPAGDYAKLVVADNGTGISKNIMDRIFDPYFTTKVSEKGTGLGLSVVHGIVNEFGGVIQINSTPGEGTEIQVYFPIIEKPDLQKKKKKAPIPTGTERVLLIDDEEAVAGLQQQMLEQLGYQVTLRTSSTEAVHFFKEHTEDFDLIITDMSMPKMSGLQLAEEIRRFNTDTPIILCTGYSDQFNDETLKSQGIQGYLMKPIVMRALGETLRNVLGDTCAS